MPKTPATVLNALPHRYMSAFGCATALLYERGLGPGICYGGR
jgi:hypothetical protein